MLEFKNFDIVTIDGLQSENKDHHSTQRGRIPLSTPNLR
jgi:hypothetical protein